MRTLGRHELALIPCLQHTTDIQLLPFQSPQLDTNIWTTMFIFKVYGSCTHDPWLLLSCITSPLQIAGLSVYKHRKTLGCWLALESVHCYNSWIGV